VDALRLSTLQLLMSEIRAAIEAGAFEDFAVRFRQIRDQY
jgi:queuine/archaeosine tRNA-ribosyltransferase